MSSECSEYRVCYGTLRGGVSARTSETCPQHSGDARQTRQSAVLVLRAQISEQRASAPVSLSGVSMASGVAKGVRLGRVHARPCRCAGSAVVTDVRHVSLALGPYLAVGTLIV
eukprot:4619161-Prymnesium_polylepis.1